jgi:hypothetical protein
MENSSLPQTPAGVQQVSVEEFHRLPGVVISGPSPVAEAPQLAATPSVPAGADRPIQQTAIMSAAPANARQVQQTGWAPVQK